MKHFRSSFFLVPLTILLIIFALGFIDSSQPDVNTTEVKSPINNHTMMMNVLWHQTAAEYRALCYQAYNVATEKLQLALKNKSDKPLAVVVDVDETILDNSPYNAGNIIGKLNYPDDFYRWVDNAECQPVPGALDFLKFAAKNKVEIFYITNRRERGKEGTLENLNKLGFPNATEETVLCKTDKSSKQPRRDTVLKDHEIALLIGDNLLDFDDVFKAETFEERNLAVDKNRDKFGNKFIIIPNVMHGEWLKMINRPEREMTENEKLVHRKNLLKSFK